MKCESIHQVAVVGLGSMGHGIAQALAASGYDVNAYDEVPEARASLGERIHRNLKVFNQAGLIALDQVEIILSRITVVASGREAVANAQFVTEAVREDLRVKQDLFRKLEADVAPETIFASNSSTFPISQSAEGMKHPGRAIVTHYFNPPHVMLEPQLGTEKVLPPDVNPARAFRERIKATVLHHLLTHLNATWQQLIDRVRHGHGITLKPPAMCVMRQGLGLAPDHQPFKAAKVRSDGS